MDYIFNYFYLISAFPDVLKMITFYERIFLISFVFAGFKFLQIFILLNISILHFYSKHR